MGNIYLFKVVLIGDGGVGKTALRRKFMGEGFDTAYIMTIGADFAIKSLDLFDSIQVKFQIWDLAGQPHFKAVREAFYKGTSGALLVYDVTRRNTFKNTVFWMEELIKNVRRVPIVLIGNKIDLRPAADAPPDPRRSWISNEEGQILKRYLEERFDVPVVFIETSAKTGENVDLAFHKLAHLLVQTVKNVKLYK
ncbi:MAG: Rab family GTPase [Candidatus Baldrarchaeia archaeon]